MARLTALEQGLSGLVQRVDGWDSMLARIGQRVEGHDNVFAQVGQRMVDIGIAVDDMNKAEEEVEITRENITFKVPGKLN